ncbi:hypothetical protein U3A55_09325 [Salarchaeum sp. III]
MADEPGLLDPTAQTYRYYRHAVENHWDPHDIDLEADADAVADLDDATFTNLRGSLAAFGAGEESVTEDLAPLAVVLDDIGDELFVTTQLYEESKHADFFDQYWRTVVTPEEDRRGMTPTSPTDDRWFSAAYVELFERMADAMDQLLVEDTPETRASAYCHPPHHRGDSRADGLLRIDERVRRHQRPRCRPPGAPGAGRRPHPYSG